LTRPPPAPYIAKPVKRHHTTTAQAELSEHLAAQGFRFTQQRRRVYDVLLQKRDHPTAEEVYTRARRTMREISMATVYNCLDALVRAGLARQVNVERGAARFCPNMHEHWHFHCNHCGSIFDMAMPDAAASAFPLPQGFEIDQFEIAAHGLCSGCSAPRRQSDHFSSKHS
jgi:Fur family peroxide stress response transcriptional regulator